MIRRGTRIFIVLILLVFLAAACNKKMPALFGTGTVTIAGHQLNIEIAETEESREQGLGGRDFLAQDDGLLFLFPTQSRFAFWMKDTKISLDFIWIKDGNVVEITPNVQPEPNVPDATLHYYLPQDPIDSAIEVNAGWAAKHNIKAGDSVTVSRY